MPSPSLRRSLFAALCAVFLAGPAEAQDAISDFFGTIFGHRPVNVQRARPHSERPRIRPASAPRRAQPRPQREYRVHRDAAPVARLPQPDRNPSESNPSQSPMPPDAEQAPSFHVVVIGDSLAARLAGGLEDAFGDDPRIAVQNKAKEESGLVRDDFYDWLKEARTLVEGAQRPDLVVMEVGVNDNQSMRVTDHQAEPLSKEFNEAYARRVEAIAAVFREKNVPLVWVGLPIMRNATLTRAALAFNDMVRQSATAAGASYVDLWEAFSDVNSAYKASGPDVNGAIVRLRGSDGIHFSDAGARKAAYFVEPEIKKVLEAKLQPAPPAEAPAAPSPSEPTPAPAPPVAAPTVEKPLAGKIIPLNDPALSPGAALSQLPASGPARAAGALAQPGRADDFAWPAQK